MKNTDQEDEAKTSVANVERSLSPTQEQGHPPKLSATMCSCLHYANEFGGVLCRYPGGFWAKRDWKGTHDAPWFGTPTVEALVSRNVMTYTDWQERSSGSGQFPIEAAVNEPARENGHSNLTKEKCFVPEFS